MSNEYYFIVSSGNIIEVGMTPDGTIPNSAVICTQDQAKNFQLHQVIGGKVVAATSQQLTDIAQAQSNENTRANLLDIDSASVRALREFIVAKFGADSLVPAELLNSEKSAILMRKNLK